MEVTYTNSDGNTVTSAIDTVGIPVAARLSFAVISPPAVITQGSDSMIDVVYQNTGAITANNAEARLSTYGPLSSADTLAYLGDIPPGGNVTAHYAISVASDAAPGTYPLNTEVRYRDALDNSQVSDTFTANVQVNARPPASPLILIVEIFIVAMVIVAAGYYVVVVRKKR